MNYEEAITNLHLQKAIVDGEEYSYENYILKETYDLAIAALEKIKDLEEYAGSLSKSSKPFPVIYLPRDAYMAIQNNKECVVECVCESPMLIKKA